MPLNKELPIAISMGEPGGINIEIVLKSIKKKLPNFFLIADPEWVKKSIKALNSEIKINVLENVDKKAYLSALSLAKYISVTCDSTSMISEAALTGKPIYVGDIPAKKDDQRIRNFKELFYQLNIIKKLETKLETWDYEILNETSRIAKEIKKRLS